MSHLLAAPDKFRGTATASEVAHAMAGAAIKAGWTTDQAPMSDGGEGLLETVGGEPRATEVSGPLGRSVLAEWKFLPATSSEPETAVIEMARAAGRALLPRPRGDDSVMASTKGVGQLVLAAVNAGARRVVIGCGGSATTDGGWGAVEAIGDPSQLDGVTIIVASDVVTPFNDAARIFGPQKGANPKQVADLSARLEQQAILYEHDFGIDVRVVPGAGAAGGLAGGLVALGATIKPGFDLVADMVDLSSRIARCDLVVTGEGHLDPPSLHGKVPGGVLQLANGRPVLCIVGGADRELLASPPAGLEVASLTALFGARRARSQTLELVELVTAEALSRFCP